MIFGVGATLLLIAVAMFGFGLLPGGEVTTEIPGAGTSSEITAAESHENIRTAQQTITRAVLGILAENGLEITDGDVASLNSAMDLLNQSKATFFSENYALAAELAENSKQLVEQLEKSLDISEANIGDVYVSPPSGEVDRFNGIWTHTIGAMRNALMNVENLKRIGVNFVAVTLDVEMDNNGNIQVVGDNDFLFYIMAFHRSGLRVLLMPDPCHPTFIRWGKYEWRTGDNSADVRRGLELLENFTPLVLGWAETAENYAVEMYSPLNEPQTFTRNSAEASQWVQQILPDLRKRYSDKLVLRTHGTFPDEVDLNFAGYDYIASWGACAWPHHLEDYLLDLRSQIDNLVAFMERDRCENAFLLDFGTAYLGGSWYEPLSEEMIADENAQAQAMQILFEEGWGKVNGFFLPVAVGWDFMGRPAENVVKVWYDENNSLSSKPIDKIWKNWELLKLIEKTLFPPKRPFYLWSYTNGVTVDNQNPGPNGTTSVTECDQYAFSHPEEADAWLRARGIEGYGSNFFLENYSG